jgi:hypothetical protein
MKIARPICLILSLTLLGLSACNLPSATVTIPKGGGGGDCSGTPAGPMLNSPSMWAVVNDLTPALSWLYTDPACVPDGYNVHLRTGPLFGDDLGGSTSANSWVPASDLQPGTEYAWGVQAVNDAITGPYAGESYFFTGPMCSADNLQAVSILSPMNNWTIHDLNDLTLMWDYPGDCLPEYYWIGLTTNLMFDGSPLNGATGNPSTRWAPGDPLTDCTRYYWMVRPGLGDTLGPYSQVYTFRVEISGGCPAESSAMIRGTVWEDQCAGLGAGTPVSPDVLPLGCALNGDQIWTNSTYDPGEPGIPGLVVSLNQGACPSTSTLRDIPTGPDGAYSFFMVTPGDYCVSIDAVNQFNSPTLLPGNWTYPAGAVGGTLASQTVTVAAGQDSNDNNFGWWYKFGTPWGNTSATVFGQVWSDLCAYHLGSPVPDPLPAGCVHDPFGVHGDKIKQPAEPGIPGVVVDIGPGDCPSAGLATAVTDVNGYYYFPGLAAGKYCLRIDPYHGSPNEAVLQSGQWTVIPSGHEGMTFRPITLVANHTLSGQNFGWDFDDALPTITPTFTLIPTFTLTPALFQVEPPFLTLDINANCRQGPGPQYESVAVGMKGEAYHIEAISADNNWLKVRYSASLRCWMGKGTGKVTGDLLKVPVLLIPTDTPTEVPYCSQFTTQRLCIAHGSDGCKWVLDAVAPYCAGP